MAKTHFYAIETPRTEWDAPGASTKAMCGSWVLEARPVMTIDLAGARIQGASTIRFCQVCMELAFAPTVGRRWIYGINERHEAEKINRNKTEEE